MSIHDLLAKFDAKDLRVQFIHDYIEKAVANRKGCRVTFRTDVVTPGDLLTGTGPVGVLVWIPQDKWKAMQKEGK